MEKFSQLLGNVMLLLKMMKLTSLVHAWDDLQKKHCNIMKEVAIEIGEPPYKCDNETLFGACGVGSWCRLCEKK